LAARTAVSPPHLLNRWCDEIDYKIIGAEMQFVEVELDPGASAVAEAGAMMYKDVSIQMNTVFRDGSAASAAGGLVDKRVGAGKRLFTGAGMFITAFTHTGNGKGHGAFAAPYPGNITPLRLTDFRGRLICQKDNLLCTAQGVSIGIFFQKELLTGLFVGEGVFFAAFQGPGRIWLQSLPFSRPAGRTLQAAPQRGGSREEGSVLGPLGGLLRGDNSL
jgi:uncharacterized protein (AIM24 family)